MSYDDSYSTENLGLKKDTIVIDDSGASVFASLAKKPPAKTAITTRLVYTDSQDEATS